MTRTVKIITTVGVAGSIETNAQTLGDLLPVLNERDIDTIGKRLVIGENLNELSNNDATLPEGDFKLYITPAKTKAGSVKKDLLSKVNTLSNIISNISDEIDNFYMEVESLQDLIDDSCSNSVSAISPRGDFTGYNSNAKKTSSEDDEDIAMARRLASDF